LVDEPETIFIGGLRIDTEGSIFSGLSGVDAGAVTGAGGPDGVISGVLDWEDALLCG